MMRFGLVGGSVATLLLSSTATLADVTAAQVWENWKTYYADLGYEVTAGAEEPGGDRLVLRDVTLVSRVPDGTVTATMPQVTMTEAQGSVTIEIPQSIPVSMTGTDAEGRSTVMGMTVAHTGLSLVASGTPDEIVYDYSAPQMTFSLDEMEAEGTPIEMTLNVTAEGLTGRSTVGADRSAESMTAREVNFALAAADPEGSGTMNLTGRITDVVGDGSMTKPEGDVGMEDMAAALAAGFGFDGTFRYGSGEYSFDLDDAGQTANFEASGGEGEIAVRMDDAGLHYGVTGGYGQVAAETSQLPFPIRAAVAATAFELTMPLAAGAEPQDFTLGLRMEELVVNEEVWAIVDPTAQLPRDPATLVLDLGGTATLDTSLLDPALAEGTATEPPGQLNTLNVNQLRLSLAGAELTGGGALTFDEAAAQPFAQMPRPEGQITLRLLGGNGLLDRLVSLGLVPEQQATGFRMMAGLFAQQGPGEDELNTLIEFREDGGIYANGQRIQ
ncbi:DUF2125 domain-containing protein [Frigidibacter oleivorans]|uniref:DUF2125 domain-containing protein n=1 Tax=Frigidibacter oleivorans TaxID=2487129 RepID=UPI0013DF428D|nr:DUF2125 domain-containing protein [Frigidibacter oleivorans]